MAIDTSQPGVTAVKLSNREPKRVPQIPTKKTQTGGRDITLRTGGRTRPRFDSDGGITESHYADMYESKYHLILENQLIYAVIQLEREGGEIKLQCRWLDGDLCPGLWTGG